MIEFTASLFSVLCIVSHFLLFLLFIITIAIVITYLPQMRIHMLRAVKTKLPKGAYVVMLTQYESLGGRPLTWSSVGLYGIGPTMPAVTRPCKHYGRYFDRVMKVEDSCFALCPPAASLKYTHLHTFTTLMFDVFMRVVQCRPSFAFVLEVFQLANNICIQDRCSSPPLPSLVTASVTADATISCSLVFLLC